jgi:hypothetical protein
MQPSFFPFSEGYLAMPSITIDTGLRSFIKG